MKTKIIFIVAFLFSFTFAQGGYRGAKWGDSMDQVKERFLSSYETVDEKPDRSGTKLIFKGGGAELECTFLKGKLFMTKDYPISQDDDERGPRLFYEMLVNKFGKEILDTSGADAKGNPIIRAIWTSEGTRAMWQMFHPEHWMRKYGSYPSSTLSIWYVDIEGFKEYAK